LVVLTGVGIMRITEHACEATTIDSHNKTLLCL
jgi:hypothetical protein